jgi:hypothetical protein
MKKHLIILLFLSTLLGGGVSAGTATLGEYQVKAAFLYNFIKFIEWPTDAFTSARQPITVAICGRDPFGDYLTEMIKGEPVQGRKIELIHITADLVPDQCQLVFVSASEKTRLAQIFANIQARHIVTVSEVEEFCEAGGAINFKVMDSKIHFEINPDVIESTGVKINSKLLRLAHIVHTRQSEE